MNRRELLTKGAALAGGVLVPKIVLGDDVFKPQNWQPSCQKLGMQGNYPNCYYPQYGNANLSLYSATNYFGSTAAHKVVSRTITPTDHAYFQQYLGYAIANLSLAQTTINECLRKQYVYPVLPTKKVMLPGELDFIGGVAGDWGFNPTDFQDWASQYIPVDTLTAPTVVDLILINSLPDYGAMDNIYSYVNNIIDNVTIVGDSPCGLSPTEIQGLQNSGAISSTIGGVIGYLSNWLPPQYQGIGKGIGGLFTLAGVQP